LLTLKGYSHDQLIMGKDRWHERYKNRKSRVVPLMAIIKDELLKLSKLNPHVSRGYLIYGTLPDAPLDCRAIERGFTKAIIKSGVIGFLLSSFLLSKLEKMKGKQ